MTHDQIITLIFASLFAVSEVLAGIPAVKANSIFGIISSILKNLAGKKDQ